MISQGWRNQKRSEEPAPLQIKRVNTRNSSSGGAWLDAMLGQGSSRTVGGAVSRFRQAAPEPPAKAPKTVLRMQAVGSGADEKAPAKSKGFLRLALACLALAAAAAKFKPWQAASSIKVSELVHVVKAPAAAVEVKLPIVDAGGTPQALWHSAGGQWYGINDKAQLSRLSEDEAAMLFKLPHLEGAALESVEKHGSRVLALGVDPSQLAELLPLRPDLAAECEAVCVQGREIRLRFTGGFTAELGEGGFRAKLEKLSAVLADLGARKKRASSVDLRFENSAVVRLASR